MFSLEALDEVLAEGPIERYINRRFTGDPHVAWEQTIARYGTFRRGLALGTSVPALEARILESNPELHLTFVDISEGALERHGTMLEERFSGRIDTLLADLNFVELEPNAYDCIISVGTIHHVMNVEYLASQVNGALTPGGYFFLQDFVAETRCHYTPERRRVYEEIARRMAVRAGIPPDIVWDEEGTLSPLCAVRSEDTLDVFATFMHPETVRTAGSLLGPMMRSRCATQPTVARWAPRRVAFLFRSRLRRMLGLRRERMLDERFLDELTRIGDILEDTGVLLPNIAFAVYRKRTEGDGR
jgi:SAM-dependent methyltransferase